MIPAPVQFAFYFPSKTSKKAQVRAKIGLPLLHYYHYIHMCWLLVFEGALKETEFIYFDIRLQWFNYIYIPLLMYIYIMRHLEILVLLTETGLFLLYKLSITYSFGILHCMKYNCFIQRNADLKTWANIYIYTPTRAINNSNKKKKQNKVTIVRSTLFPIGDVQC